MWKVGKHLKLDGFQETSFQRKKNNKPNQKTPNVMPNHVLEYTGLTDGRLCMPGPVVLYISMIYFVHINV